MVEEASMAWPGREERNCFLPCALMQLALALEAGGWISPAEESSLGTVYTAHPMYTLCQLPVLYGEFSPSSSFKQHVCCYRPAAKEPEAVWLAWCFRVGLSASYSQQGTCVGLWGLLQDGVVTAVSGEPQFFTT